MPKRIKSRYKLVDGKLIGFAKKRDRRPEPEELDKIFKFFDEREPRNVRSYALEFSDILKFCISSAMRISEVCSLQWNDLNEEKKTIIVRDRKHKKEEYHQIVPLLDESLENIKRQERIGKYIYPIPAKTVTVEFHRALSELKIENLRLYDLRHEGASRLFEMGYQIHEVAMFTGHEDWKMLQRYTHLKAKDLRRLEPIKVETPAEMDTANIEEMKKAMRAEIMEEMMLKMMSQQKAA